MTADEKLRLKCLKLASKKKFSANYRVEVASRLEEYVKHGKPRESKDAANQEG